MSKVNDHDSPLVIGLHESNVLEIQPPFVGYPLWVGCGLDATQSDSELWLIHVTVSPFLIVSDLGENPLSV